jgi:hypothetical protein
MVSAPAHCGAEAGEYCAIWLGPEMPGDQRGDDALSLCFDGAPLDADLDILGAPKITLRLSVDRPQAQIAVRLNHIHPDGAVSRITYGVLNLSHRLSAADPRPMIPGQAEEITFHLDHIAYRVPRGHRMRIALSDSYWPLIWPSPEKTTLQLTEGHLELPKRPSGSGDEIAFAPPDAAEPWETETLRPENHIRRREIDQVSGLVRLVIEDDFGAVRDLDHGLITGSIARETWEIHPDDPTSARGSCHWTDTLERGKIQLRTEARCAMTSDSQSFHLTAEMTAYENDQIVFERSFAQSIPRDHL